MKSSFWQWLMTNPKTEVTTMAEPTTAPPKPVGVREIALGVYLGSLMVAGTAFALWFIWITFKP
jgi:hypothetical protein